MAGLYIHIPFCASRCIYCDFFSTTQLNRREAYVHALCRELQARSTELSADSRPTTINTIYLGGGTPSQLSPTQLDTIMDTIHQHYHISPDAETTLEANPSDINADYANRLIHIGFNRVSLGIQTFNDHLLHTICRRHNSQQALHAIQHLRHAGCQNLSIDLIYGLPTQTIHQWHHDVETAINLRPEHLSAYALMYEEGTKLHQMLQHHQVEEADEELSLNMYNHLCTSLAAAGYQHYEISNFALPHHHSRHNSCYWDNTPYIGIGAGAHSYDGQQRRCNIPDLDTYITHAGTDTTYYDTEHLTPTQQLNETIMTRLRTAHGLDLTAIGHQFGNTAVNHIHTQATPYIQAGKLQFDTSRHTLRLTHDGIFTSNDIIATLFVDEK